jgi:hypothetical protein
MPMSDVRFVEEQRFRQWWLILLVLFVVAVTAIPFGSGMVQQLVSGQPWGDKPLPDGALVGVGIFAIGIPLGVAWLLLAARLTTTVGDATLHVQLWPIHRKRKELDLMRLTKIEAQTYRPLRDYGGWGVRRGRKGWAYNVSGDRGVLLTYDDGETVLIGSQRDAELADAIEAARKRARASADTRT